MSWETTATPIPVIPITITVFNEIYYLQLFVITFDYEGFNSSIDEKA